MHIYSIFFWILYLKKVIFILGIWGTKIRFCFWSQMSDCKGHIKNMICVLSFQRSRRSAVLKPQRMKQGKWITCPFMNCNVGHLRNFSQSKTSSRETVEEGCWSSPSSGTWNWNDDASRESQMEDFFTERGAGHWNRLPSEVLMVPNLSEPKECLINAFCDMV